MMEAGKRTRLLALAWIALTGTVVAACGDGSSDPTISGTPAGTATVGRLYSFEPRVIATEGSAISFTIAHRPSWAVFDPSR